MSVNKSRRVHAVIIGATALVVAATSTPAAADTLTLQGSTTVNSRLMVPYQTVIEKESGHKLIVVPNKSSLGLLALFEKRGDLAMTSTSLESEVALLMRTKASLPFD